MARKFALEETCYVPTVLLPEGANYSVSIYQTVIKEIKNKSVKVLLKDGTISDWITTSKVNKHIGIAIINIGDFSTEETLLDPLAKSILQFSRLLLDDASVTLIKVRSLGELAKWWKINHAAFSHVVFVGHGSSKSIVFGCDGTKTPEDFEKNVFSEDERSKVFICLCCKTGKNAFASSFSSIPVCGHLIAPYHSVHGSVASQFYQTLMCWHLLNGRSIKIAFNKAKKSIAGETLFRSWVDGIQNTKVSGWSSW